MISVYTASIFLEAFKVNKRKFKSTKQFLYLIVFQKEIFPIS